jgi:hypothetical protein
MSPTLGEWREDESRPLPGSAARDRLVSRGISCSPCSACGDSFSATRFPPLQRSLPGPSVGVFKAWRNLSVRCGPNQNQTRGRDLPPPAGRPRTQVKERVGRTTPFSSSAMSSGRLFLDRVGRHQSPSPLHRHEQINTRPRTRQAKDDISTLPGTRHFYFALTPAEHVLTSVCWRNKFGAIQRSGPSGPQLRTSGGWRMRMIRLGIGFFCLQ